MLKKQLSEKANKENISYTLSYGQKALYFLYLNSPESSVYNVAFTARILSKLDTDALKRSFQKLVNSAPSLRTNYKIIDGKPVQEIRGYREVFFEVINAAGLDENSLRKKVKQTNEIPFDLEKGDLFKIYLFKINDENFVMLMSMHHVVSDGWSIGLMFQELKNLYTAESEGKQYAIVPAVKKYSDYIDVQNNFINSDKGDEQWNYWKNELKGDLPQLNLPIDKARPAIQTFQGGSVYFNLDKDLVEQLKKLSKNEGTTLFVTLLSAYQIFLHRYTSQDDIIAGSPTAGRNQTDFERVIGYFINPVAIRGDFSGNESFKIFLSQIKKKVLGAISNQDFPFALIVERLLQRRDPARSPVFQTFFGLQKVQQNDEIQEMIVPGNDNVRINWGKLILESFEITQQEGQFDLTVEFVEGKNLFSGYFKYNIDLFEEDSIIKMIEHFKNLLQDIVSNPEKKISELQMLSDAEKNIILNEWNNTDFVFDNFNCVHKLIEEQAFKTPGSVAVVFEDETISYYELNNRANQLANYLIRLGVNPETLVGICVERSIEMVIGILGILKAGGAYIPIDTSYPQSRIEFMISDSNAKVLITQKSIAETLPENISKIVFIDDDWKKISNESSDNFDSKVTLDNIAYVIYTSGSTGFPKGVMITHRSLSNHMLWMKDAFGFDSADSVLQKTPFSFDASVWEFYLPLILGGKLVMAIPEGHMDIAYLTETIQKNNISILQLVPTLLRMLLDENGIENCKSLRTVFCGGEALTLDLKEKLFQKLNVNLYNLYGPTEATIDATYFKCEPSSENKIIPIGKPIYNTQAYILDKFLNPLPAGVQGELMIGGVDVARGYLNNPGLTKEKFISDIFKKTIGAKLYRTGDLAKYFKNGNIEFIGRADHQIKLRGFRIELGEIESKLSQHKEIKDATVIVREDKPGNQRLTAYIVPKNSETVSINDIKVFLRNSLPEYMIPTAFISLEKMPLLPNGKIDRNSLPAPETSKSGEETFVAPRIPAEEILAEIWKEILGFEKVGIHDNFFELGGDSIMSIQIISRANQSGIKITPKQIFQFQTIAELSGVINYSAPEISEQGIVTGEVPLTPIQHWFFEQNLPEPDFYNHSVLLKVPKNLNEKFLKESVEEIVKHHDALRLRFKKINSIPEQINSGLSGAIVFSVEDLSDIPGDRFDYEMEKNISEFQRSLDLSDGPLIKVLMFKAGPNDADRLLIVIHHLCIDGISWRIIPEDLFNSYRQLSAGEEIKLPHKTTSFKDWSNKLSGFAKMNSLEKELDHWLSILDMKSNKMPADFSSDENKNTVESADKVS
ncbi:MAG: amino acid adenylation domain-containing protein, partial [bacterium]